MTSTGACKDICKRHTNVTGMEWGYGKWRCSVCFTFINHKGIKYADNGKIYCGCCGYRVQLKPRTSQGKDQLRERLKLLT